MAPSAQAEGTMSFIRLIHFSKVLLPQPLGPMKAVTWRARMSRLMFLMAWKSPYHALKFFRWIARSRLSSKVVCCWLSVFVNILIVDPFFNYKSSSVVLSVSSKKQHDSPAVSQVFDFRSRAFWIGHFICFPRVLRSGKLLFEPIPYQNCDGVHD